jgi:vacuolar-type H+-ATPase subunit F/Vma7
VTGNPQFFGSNPAEVRTGPRKGLRVLAAEEDRARALLDALTAEQKKVAIITDKAYPDILTTTERKAAIEGKPAGLEASKMTAAQRKLLDDLLAEYVNNLPEPLSTQRRDRIKQAGTNLFFAWAGVVERGGPHYYRVQAPGFLVEYDNTQNNANHIHCVWRDFTDDWGADLLEQHYKESPHHQK